MNLNNLHRLWEMNMNQILFERLFLVQLFLAFNNYSPSGSPHRSIDFLHDSHQNDTTFYLERLSIEF